MRFDFLRSSSCPPSSVISPTGSGSNIHRKRPRSGSESQSPFSKQTKFVHSAPGATPAATPKLGSKNLDSQSTTSRPVQLPQNILSFVSDLPGTSTKTKSFSPCGAPIKQELQSEQRQSDDVMYLLDLDTQLQFAQNTLEFYRRKASYSTLPRGCPPLTDLQIGERKRSLNLQRKSLNAQIELLDKLLKGLDNKIENETSQYETALAQTIAGSSEESKYNEAIIGAKQQIQDKLNALRSTQQKLSQAPGYQDYILGVDTNDIEVEGVLLGMQEEHLDSLNQSIQNQKISLDRLYNESRNLLKKLYDDTIEKISQEMSKPSTSKQ